MTKTQNEKSGFALIGLIITILIIGLLMAFYFGNKNDGKESVKETGDKAVEQTKENNKKLLEQQVEIQNNLNKQ
jgi:competence protein ComGC